jgi:hypothetical protein
MVVGFRTDIGPDRFVNLVEIATLDPLAGGTPGTPMSPHGQIFTASWTNILQPRPRIYPLTSSRYPIRIRVYDQEGGLLKESQARLSWEFATNGFIEICQLTRDDKRLGVTGSILSLAGYLVTFTNTASGWPCRAALSATLRGLTGFLEYRERAAIRGLTALLSLFTEIQTAEALGSVRDHAFQVVRPPNLLRLLTELGFTLKLELQFDAAESVTSPAAATGEPRVRFPVLLKQNERVLATVELLAGPADGPFSLTAGVREIRVMHPQRTDRTMLAKVLAVGHLALENPDESQ